MTEGAQLITREYALYCQSRFVAQATGEHTFYSKSNLSYGKACESAKSNALMRCCKDLGIASELWDPQVYCSPLLSVSCCVDCALDLASFPGLPVFVFAYHKTSKLVRRPGNQVYCIGLFTVY